MSSDEIREKYLKFFEARGHARIEPSPLVLENDPTTLFTSSGMQPLVPYLMGEPHTSGSKRLVNSQPSIRLQDIDEVGDSQHTTFFEMLGNWSLGDYFKKEQLRWIFDFLTDKNEGLGLKVERLYVSVFGGDEGFSVNGKLNQLIPDLESMSIWTELFLEKGIEAKVANLGNQIPDITKGRIFYYGVDKNWWSRTGTPAQMPVGEIGGPDSEIFYDFGEEPKLHMNSPWKSSPCHPNCSCGRFLEIGNSVFMQYKKVGEKALEELPNKNVDFGGGLERITAAVNDDPNIFNTDLFSDAKKELEDLDLVRDKKSEKAIRVILDHLRASMFIAGTSEVKPSNKTQGYILRRLIRRVALHSKVSNIDLTHILNTLLMKLSGPYRDIYPLVSEKRAEVHKTIEEEIVRFEKALTTGQVVKEINAMDSGSLIQGEKAFDYYQTYGWPLEVIKEYAESRGIDLDIDGFEEARKKHQEKSRTSSSGVFKGGLADHSPEVVRLHTATHLLLASLRKVLGEYVVQKGQNITKERSRFDFPNPEKLTNKQLEEVEDMINDVIKRDLPVNFKVMSKEEALKTGAIHAFNEKYTDTVKVYYVGKDLEDAFSKEFCGGPHVSHTSQIGRVKIIKQEKVGADIVRIYATVF